MKRKILYSIFLVAVYFGALIALKYLDIWGARFYASGFPVIVYIFLKAVFAGYFLMILLSAGAVLQRIVLPKSGISSIGLSAYSIACFFSALLH